MARQTNTVQVISVDGETHLRWVSPDDALVLLEEKHWDGSFKYEYDKVWAHGKGFQWKLQTLPEPSKFKDSPDQSNCSLTLRDMLGNVGLTETVIHSLGDEEVNAITKGEQYQIRVRVEAHNPRLGRVVRCMYDGYADRDNPTQMCHRCARKKQRVVTGKPVNEGYCPRCGFNDGVLETIDRIEAMCPA